MLYKLFHAGCAIIVIAVLSICIPTASALTVTVEPDDFADGIDISELLPGISLSAVGGYDNLDGSVYVSPDGLASTGTNVFANNLSFERQWYLDDTRGFALRADFTSPADTVAIDIIGDDPDDIGTLTAYNAAGEIIETVTTAPLNTGQIFTAQINAGAFEIAYIIAGGQGNTVHLDNLTVSLIPEPATLLLLSIGAIAIRKRRRNPQGV